MGEQSWSSDAPCSLLCEVVGLAGDLDTLVKVFLEIGTVHDTILHRVRAVYEELDLVLLPQLLHSFALSLQLLLTRLSLSLSCLSGSHSRVPLLRELGLL